MKHVDPVVLLKWHNQDCECTGVWKQGYWKSGMDKHAKFWEIQDEYHVYWGRSWVWVKYL